MSDSLDAQTDLTPDQTDTRNPSVRTILPKLRPTPAEKADSTVNPKATAKLTLPKKNKTATALAPKKEIQDVTEWMDREYRGVSIYAVLMGVLLTLILWTGISTVRQIQAYHQQYTQLQKTKKEYRKLQIEHQRLLIEQQTFSATPQIARRAVTELNMFYPRLSDRMIIQLPAPATAVSATSGEGTP